MFSPMLAKPRINRVKIHGIKAAAERDITVAWAVTPGNSYSGLRQSCSLYRR